MSIVFHVIAALWFLFFTLETIGAVHLYNHRHWPDRAGFVGVLVWVCLAVLPACFIWSLA